MAKGNKKAKKSATNKASDKKIKSPNTVLPTKAKASMIGDYPELTKIMGLTNPRNKVSTSDLPSISLKRDSVKSYLSPQPLPSEALEYAQEHVISNKLPLKYRNTEARMPEQAQLSVLSPPPEHHSSFKT